MPHSAVYATYRDFCSNAQSNHVIFYYRGYFSQHIIAAMADALRVRLEQSGAAGPTRRRLFSAFIEMAQNIIHYSADTLTAPDETDGELRHGSVCIGHQAGLYYLLCANPVEDNVARALQGRLENVRAMSLEQIRNAYRDSLRGDPDPQSKGAGLGFLTMAREASEPLEFEFQPCQDTGLSMFYLKAVI